MLILLKNRGTNDPYATLEDDVHYLPVMSHEFFDQDGLLSYLESPEFASTESTIITSQRAVEAVANISIQLSEDSRISLFSKPTFTVGPATAELLRFHGFTDVRGEDAGNGRILSSRLLNEPYKKYIFFTGKTRHDAIPDTLNSMNDTILSERVVYNTASKPGIEGAFVDLVKDARPTIVFFSPAYVHPIVEVLKGMDRGKFVLAAIGPTTEEYLKGCELDPDVVAEKPDPVHLKAALESRKQGL